MATKVKFYLDEHSPRTLQRALLEHGLVVYTRDLPFAGRTAKRFDHAGLICWTGNQQDVGGTIRAVLAFGERHSAEAVAGQVFWLK